MKPLEELLEIAKCAKDGKEFWIENGSFSYGCTENKEYLNGWKASGLGPWNVIEKTDFIATFNPQTVIDLITQLKDAQEEIEKLKTGLGVAGEFIKRNEQLEKDNEAYKHVNSCLMAEITELKKRNGWLESGFIHTCHDECQRPLCLANRENTKLEQRLAECETALKKSLEFGEYTDWAIDADKNLQQLDIDSRAYLSKWSVK